MAYSPNRGVVITGLGVVAPNGIGKEELEPRYGLNLVQTEASSLSGSTVLLGGRAIGGANVVLALRKTVK